MNQPQAHLTGWHTPFTGVQAVSWDQRMWATTASNNVARVTPSEAVEIVRQLAEQVSTPNHKLS